MTGPERAQRAYRACLHAYPAAYRAEFGPEMLATLVDANGPASLSLREMASLVRGGVRQRAAAAHAGGPAATAVSALRGALVAASLFTLLTVWSTLPVSFREAGLLHSAGWTVHPSAGRIAIALISLVGVLVGSAALAAGRRRLAGVVILAAAVSTTAAVLVGEDALLRVAALLPPIGLVVLGPPARPASWPARRALAGAGVAAVAVALLLAGVSVTPVTWLALHQSWAVAGLVALGTVLAPLDGRLALGAAVTAGIEQLWSVSLVGDLRPMSPDTFLRGDAGATVLVYAAVCALWGGFWIWRRGRVSSGLRSA